LLLPIASSAGTTTSASEKTIRSNRKKDRSLPKRWFLERRKQFPSGRGVSAFRCLARDPISLPHQAPRGGVQMSAGCLEIAILPFCCHRVFLANSSLTGV
jgi:hypothetical protein